MKPTLNYLAISLTLVAITFLASCVTTTAPDGTITKTPDHSFWSGAAATATHILTAKYAPKAEPVIHPTK